MAPDYTFLLVLLATFTTLDVLVVVLVFIFKNRARLAFRLRTERTKRINRLVAAVDMAGLAAEYLTAPRAVLSHLRRLLESATPPEATRSALADFLASIHLEDSVGPGLGSVFLHRRIEAYLNLGLKDSPESQALLMKALAREEHSLGRLVLLTELARHEVSPDVPGLIAQIDRGRDQNRTREINALDALASRLRGHFDEAGLPETETGLRLFLMAVRRWPREEDWERLALLAEERDDAVAEEAAAILATSFPPGRFRKRFLWRAEPRFRRPLAAILGLELAPVDLGLLRPWFEDVDLRDDGIAAARGVLLRHPGSESAFLRIIEEDDGPLGIGLSLALEDRLPSLLFHAGHGLSPALRAFVGNLLAEKRVGVFVEVLGSTLSSPIRSDFMGLLREDLKGRPDLATALVRTLSPGAVAELDLEALPPEPDRPRIPVSDKDKAFLATLVLGGLAIFPLAFVLLRGGQLATLAWSEIAYLFIFDFQYLFAFYTLAVNGIYLILLGLSVAKLLQESSLWKCDLTRTLSGPGILPSLSIIAPAYNEEKTIVESLHSLFALMYPTYEVIVVNDGSKDGTLAAMIEAFALVPKNVGWEGRLASMPVRTVYRSPTFPNLTVVDKSNGGKADALNAGLNHATGDYICTIDADSILDPQALLRAMFQVVASDHEVIAVGGNVFPVNGCKVDHGHLQNIAIPDVPLVRFQIVEYLRSFVAGRLGWTILDSLLIISGAFGIFRRTAVMELGGYLTGSGVYRHETVGEDMEIVVRLTRRDREEKRGGRVLYAYNANCWTEVPEDAATLRRQRDRWHRGLMEVLCFHRDMALRPRYRTTGLLSLPYFYCFELVGPWLETLGYVVLAAVLALNLIDPIIPLTVFGIAVSFGALISVASFLLAEQQILYFRNKEFVKLLLISLIENFGFRQLMSMGRVWSNFMFFFVSRGWGRQTRVGFGQRKAAT